MTGAVVVFCLPSMLLVWTLTDRVLLVSVLLVLKSSGVIVVLGGEQR